MADQMLPLRLFTLGPPEVRLGENLVTFPTRKTLALLIYLAIEAGMQPREHLAALLWPEASPERSYANLRNTLGHLQTALRQASGQAQTPYLSVTHNSLGLNPDADIDLDLHTIEQRLRAGTRRPFEPDAAGGFGQPALTAVGRCLPARRFSGRIFAGRCARLRRLGSHSARSLASPPGPDPRPAVRNPVCQRRVCRRRGNRLALDCPGCAERSCLSPQDACPLSRPASAGKRWKPMRPVAPC